MKKITVNKALSTLKEIKGLGDRQVSNKVKSASGEIVETTQLIEAVKIPAEKSKAGYWLGRLSDSLESIQSSYNKTLEVNQKRLSKPATMKNESGEEVEIAGQITFDAESLKLYNEAMALVGEQEEEIACVPDGGFDYEMFDGVVWPASFWKEISAFLKEPK